MNPTVADVRSETAYDALQDGLPVLLRVLSGTRTVEALAQAEKTPAGAVEKQLGRLVRAGLLRSEGGAYEAVATAIRQTRQEGMVTFLSRYFLPLLTRVAEEPGDGFVVQLDLSLEPGEQATLRDGVVHDMLMELAAISDEPADEHVPCTAVVVGTSDVPGAMEPGDRLLETMRRTARQRSTPDQRERAVLTQLDGLYGLGSVARAEERVRKVAETFAARQAQGNNRPSYTLVLGFCARPARERGAR